MYMVELGYFLSIQGVYKLFQGVLNQNFLGVLNENQKICP